MMHRVYGMAAAVFAADQLSKLYVLKVLELPVVKHLEVFPPYFQLHMAWNYGINFGLLSGGTAVTRILLIGVALLITGWVGWWIRRETRPWAQISAGFLIGGAMGNVIDRLVYGAVADFLNVTCCGIENRFSFNIADIAIFAGAVGLVIFTGERKTT